MKTNKSNPFLLILAATAALISIVTAHAQTAVTGALGFYLTNEGDRDLEVNTLIVGNWDPTLPFAPALVARASAYDAAAGTWNGDLYEAMTPVLETMVEDLIAVDLDGFGGEDGMAGYLQGVGGQEGEEDRFFRITSAIAQELILELLHVRTTGTSDYFSQTTLDAVRRPVVNDAFVRFLVKSLR